MSWAEIKSSLNSRVGTKNFSSLDELIEIQSYDSVYKNAKILSSFGVEAGIDKSESMQFVDKSGFSATSPNVVINQTTKHLFLENGYKTIGEQFAIVDAQAGGSLSSVYLPPTVESIERDAFRDQYTLSNISLPRKLKRIGSGAFLNIGITNLVLSGKISSIDTSAFALCQNLKTVIIDSTEDLSIGHLAFEECESLDTVYILANGNVTLADDIFAECRNLSNIYVSWSVGEVVGAPWGASSDATIHYNVTEVA